MSGFAVHTAFRAVDTVSRTFLKMSKSARTFQKSSKAAFNTANKGASRFQDITKGILAASAVQRGIQNLRQFTEESIEATRTLQAMETAYVSVFGKKAAGEIEFVRKEANRLGLVFMESSGAYKAIAAASRGTTLEGQQTREVFLGVSEAAAALQLTGEQTGGALKALEQIMSKGKVQAEELRGQLGERIPGAFQIAARAMGMTTKALDKMMSDGKLVSEDFLPKFAKQLRKEFGKSAIEAADSFQAATNRQINFMLKQKKILGTVLIPVVKAYWQLQKRLLGPLTKWAEANQALIKTKVELFIKKVNSALDVLIPLLKTGFKIFIKLWPTIKNVAIAMVVLKVATLAYAATLKTLALLGAIGMFLKFVKVFYLLAKAKGIATAAMWAFNIAVTANPIGLIVAGVVALIAILFVLEKKFGILSKSWELMKKGFVIALDFMKKSLNTWAFAFLSTWGRIIQLVLAGASKIGGLIGIDTTGLKSISDSITKARKSTKEGSFFGEDRNESRESPNKEDVSVNVATRVEGEINVKAEPGTSATSRRRQQRNKVNLNMIGANL